MSSPEVSQRVAAIVGVRQVPPDDRFAIAAAVDVDSVEVWSDLPRDIRLKLLLLQAEPTYDELAGIEVPQVAGVQTWECGCPDEDSPSLVTHLPGRHDQKDHGRRYGPNDVRPPRARASTKTSIPRSPRKAKEPPTPPPLTVQQQAMRERREPISRSTKARMRAIYGPRLRELDDSPQVEAAVQGLAEIPDNVHRMAANYFDGWFPSAGIYFGSGQMVDFVAQARPLANERPRGYAEGRTWRDSGGMHMGGERIIAVGATRSEVETPRFGDDTRFRGTAQHELGHAVDAALGNPSARAEWREQVRKLSSSDQLVINPYFSPAGNPDGWASESFAQAMRGWTAGLGSTREGDRVFNMLNEFGFFKRDFTKVGYEQDFDPQLVEAAQHMIQLFDQVAGVE